MEPSISLERYDVSSEHGFLPSEPPLEKLPSQYQSWESIACNLPSLISGKEIVDTIVNLPVIPTATLTTTREFQRAYVLLGFIANAYLWGDSKPLNVETFIEIRFSTTDF